MQTMEIDSQRVLLCVSSPRDGELAAQALDEVGVRAEVTASVASLCEQMTAGAGAALIAEDVIEPDGLAALEAVLRAQPAWSDFPFIVVTKRRVFEQSETALSRLGNVTLLDPPLRIRTLRRAVHAALRARGRQYSAARAIAERDQFLAMLGHELRNPLSAIDLAAAVAARRTDHEVREITIIQNQAKHLTRLVDDLLDVARVTRGKVNLRLGHVDFAALVHDTVDTMASQFADANIAIDIVHDGRQAVVSGDADRLRQVVSNLLGNALKYTPEGGHVSVQVTASDDMVDLVVEDDGVGMAPSILSRAFEPFSQADATLARSKGGMGIGLAMVQAIVRMHGGEVSAHSAGPGRGSRFQVSIARVDGEVVRAPEQPRPASSTRPGALVIVDDHEDALELLATLMQARGFTVVTANTGCGGIESIVNDRPAGAIVDIGLPDIDGYEVARQVRAVLGDAVRLVALSGYGQPDDRRRSAEAGFDAHFTKPADVSKLIAFLQAP